MNKLSLGIITLVCASVVSSHPTRKHGHTNPNHGWEQLKLSLAWPETVCKEWVRRGPGHTCTLPRRPDSWTVHGVWPDSARNRPETCNSTWRFDPEQVKGIEDQLMDAWTNVKDGTGEYSFWAHEWKKHGTCAAQIEPLNSELKYFSMALKWHQQYDMGLILARHGIVPDDHKQYDLMEIYNAVKDALSISPSVQCRRERRMNFLSEIRFCFDKNLKIRSCETVSNVMTNCDSTQGILYPLSNNYGLYQPIPGLKRF